MNHACRAALCFWFLCAAAQGQGIAANGAAAGRDDGLLLYYPFDQDGGDVVRDASGGGRTGQVHGAQWVADGARGGAYRFDSNEQSIWADDAGLPAGDAPRTMAVWIKLNVLYPEMTTGLLTYGQLRWNRASGIGMDWRDGRDQYYFSQNGGVALSRQKMTSPGEWHHLAYTYGGNGQHHLYVDGVLTDGRSELGGPIDTVLSGKLMIGGHPGSVGPNGGYLDDVRIYGRALTAEEIQELAVPSNTDKAPANESMVAAANPAKPAIVQDSGAAACGPGTVAQSAAPFELQKIEKSTAVEESMVLQWASVPGRAYEVHWTDDLTRGFTIIASNLVAGGTETSFTNEMLGARASFYRVKIQE